MSHLARPVQGALDLSGNGKDRAMLAARPLETPAAAPGFRSSPRRSRAWSEAEGSRHLLILRFAVLNLVALALLGAAWLKGWVDLVIDGDRTRVVVLIAAVFGAGLLECARKLWQTSAELDALGAANPAHPVRVRHHLQPDRRDDGHARALAGSVLKLKLAARNAPIRHVANSLVLMGLIGTVIGFIIALSGVDPATAGDVNAIGPMVSTLIGGMSVELYTTLVGAILNIWLMLNYRLLESGTVRLLAAVVELGERRV
jgi:biopolymer transport protein ExbB/TolQ